jgi:hypothetical protein
MRVVHARGVRAPIRWPKLMNIEYERSTKEAAEHHLPPTPVAV